MDTISAILNSPWMVVLPGLAGVGLLMFSEPLKIPKPSGGIVAKLRSYIPWGKANEGDAYRTAIQGIREKASHRGCFATCEERIDAFTKLDQIDALLDKLFPAEAK